VLKTAPKSPKPNDPPIAIVEVGACASRRCGGCENSLSGGNAMVRSWMFYIPGVRHLAVAGHGDPQETQQAFDQYLQLWSDNEHRGCDGVFLSEHHSIGVSLSPSPHLLIAALSQRTSRLRFA
jgi:hypothetical protein